MNKTKATIEVLGSGCKTCKVFFEIVNKAAKELDFPVEVCYVADVQRIIKLGLMQSPVLVVNGKPVFAGFTSDTEKIKEFIRNNL